ncbi:hypothetical protein O9K51_10667 [Purpureocillium lavendulum]|uniref:Protein kinase domain-containing protein n=1 Tax=Purpureocillium lavendulum TaxID=1247861 RepID=A0AB34FBZ0_9HYPO|nr:hypothetical protein O9K51_10667 [Purpureocillium lavendulum]
MALKTKLLAMISERKGVHQSMMSSNEGKKLLLTVGKQDYSLVRRLGWGSFGVVFEAHTKDKGVVAIKFKEPYNPAYKIW